MGFRVLLFRIKILGFSVLLGLGLRLWDLVGFWGLGFHVPELGYGFRVQGWGFRVDRSNGNNSSPRNNRNSSYHSHKRSNSDNSARNSSSNNKDLTGLVGVLQLVRKPQGLCVLLLHALWQIFGDGGLPK